MATKNIIIHHMTKSPKIHIHGVYFLYNSLFGIALNRLVPGGKKIYLIITHGLESYLRFVFSPLRNSRCYQTVDFSFFTGETIFRCDLINFTGFDSHIFETDVPVGPEPSDGAFKFQVSSPSGNHSHFVVMDELGLPSRMFETGFEPIGKKRVNNYFNLRWIELIKSALDDDQLAQLNASQFLI
ncbi:unnamed protein product [Brassica napus]|uniref:(rape) hypothetical protein n=1 Tax=Brassica napus TaxID=3708 RepID=A0A816L8F3_BRANA|nr:unnamed protein product [Brassica napus]